MLNAWLQVEPVLTLTCELVNLCFISLQKLLILLPRECILTPLVEILWPVPLLQQCLMWVISCQQDWLGKKVSSNSLEHAALSDSRLRFLIQTIIEDGTQKNSLDVGTYLMTELAKLRDKYEIIGDVRGKGLQIGVEMVKDKVLSVWQKRLSPLLPCLYNTCFCTMRPGGRVQLCPSWLQCSPSVFVNRVNQSAVNAL